MISDGARVVLQHPQDSTTQDEKKDNVKVSLPNGWMLQIADIHNL